MDNLFLSREVGSIETGPQTFAGTDVQNTTFIFRREPLVFDPPGLLNSVLVQNAGLNSLNGVFVYTTEFDSKPYYNKDGNSDLFIFWFLGQWMIVDFAEDAFEPIYFSFEDVPYPWHVENWSVLSPIYNPAPTVTKVL
jgi:hypothetical protein